MSSQPRVMRIVIDLRRNELVLELDRPLEPSPDGAATIDIGAAGRLLGVEIGDTYLAIADAVPGSELHTRASRVQLPEAATPRRIRIPRAGEGWEISFPSGNACWRQGANGETTCSVVETT